MGPPTRINETRLSVIELVLEMLEGESVVEDANFKMSG
jgi:hypothetical protein